MFVVALESPYCLHVLGLSGSVVGRTTGSPSKSHKSHDSDSAHLPDFHATFTCCSTDNPIQDELKRLLLLA